MPNPVVIVEITPVGGGPSTAVPPADFRAAPIRTIEPVDYVLVLDVDGNPARIPWNTVGVTVPGGSANSFVDHNGEAWVDHNGEAVIF